MMRTLHRPSALLTFLQSIGKSPNKKLSQNFLVDKNIVDKMLLKADIQKGDYVLEIGSGHGILTEGLMEKKALIVVIEKDKTYAKYLQHFSPATTIFQQDILQFDFSLLKQYFFNKKIKVVANLPYHIATPILFLLLHHHDLFSSFTLMLQKEMAQRAIAAPNTHNYRALSLLLQYYADIEIAFSVSKNCFYPKPRVDSAILHGQFRSGLCIKNPKQFFSFVEMLFGQKRKQILPRLKKAFPHKALERIFHNLHLSKEARVQNLTGMQLALLFQQLISE